MDEPFRDPPPPTGFRIKRGATVVKEYSCPLCPTRACICFSCAWEESKREAKLRGGHLIIETLDGRQIAETRATGGKDVALPKRRRKESA